MQKIIVLVVLALQYVSSDRAYEGECPAITPMPNFNMGKFLGTWYQVQPDSGADEQNDQEMPSCEYYDIFYSDQPNKYIVNSLFELYARFEGNTPLQYESVSTNVLTVLNEYIPAKMHLMPIAGARTLETNITVFKTDYESFAIISNCDKELNDGEIQFSQHTTLWSRSRDISAVFMEKLYENIGYIDFDPYDLSSITTTGCLEGGKKLVRVNLDNDEIIP